MKDDDTEQDRTPADDAHQRDDVLDAVPKHDNARFCLQCGLGHGRCHGRGRGKGCIRGRGLGRSRGRGKGCIRGRERRLGGFHRCGVSKAQRMAQRC